MGNWIDESGAQRRGQTFKCRSTDVTLSTSPSDDGGGKERSCKDWNLGHYNF